MILHLIEQDIEFQAIFSDTGWEHPWTYNYVHNFNQCFLGGKLKILRSSKYKDFPDLVRGRKRVPSPKRSYCTSELKVIPTIEYIQSLDDEVTNFVGIRAEESPRRAKMPEYNYDESYDCWIKRPIFNWTAPQVFEIHRRFNWEPNPLYKRGVSRVGCYPCIKSNHQDLKALNEYFPEVWDRIKSIEEINDRSFFSPKYIPARFCSRKDPKSKKHFPMVEDVKKYLIHEEQSEMFPVEKCSSIYNLCE